MTEYILLEHEPVYYFMPKKANRIPVNQPFPEAYEEVIYYHEKLITSVNEIETFDPYGDKLFKRSTKRVPQNSFDTWIKEGINHAQTEIYEGDALLYERDFEEKAWLIDVVNVDEFCEKYFYRIIDTDYRLGDKSLKGLLKTVA